jgi:hypothetical protein
VVAPIHVPVMFWAALAPVDVGLVGEEESPPPHPATVPISSTATTPTAHLRRFSKRRAYQEAGEATEGCGWYPGLRG